MSAAEESVILCEGFHDRAFWAGLLERKLQCTDARPKLANGNLGTAMDPFCRQAGSWAVTSRFTRRQESFFAYAHATVTARYWP
jgi:hypothetical protein